MRVALVHDDLIQFGGAENILLALHKIFPEAPVYTALASRKWKKVCKKEGIKLKTSFMQRLPFAERLNRYYAPFLLHALAFESFDFSDFDLVISVSARYAHGIITKPMTKHICYMNSPGRMFWESQDYFESESFGALNGIKALAKPFLALPLSWLRNWDYTAAQRVDYFIANSRTPQARIKKYYGRDSEIIYPFVETEKFSHSQKVVGDHFLVLTRLASWKKVEIAIKACTKLGLKLKIVGAGPDEARLKKIAGGNPNIEFLGHIIEEQKRELLFSARALINTQYEDFGIVPLEAMASGTPVIAFEKGGAVETVIEGKTGEFFPEQTPESLAGALENFDPSKYHPDTCKTQARKFDYKHFEAQIKAFVKRVQSH